ncbi:MAG TPA: CsbD family protein [Amycolatopsis sp.]|uniref:CsbD family protein n=1 Tax=Amycolatopsis sp. TaxID=37632 RepID=UPI002B475050|nr:CsbD family protein [Amycolatopsis sp.]HKS44612.1 CsbD family protein [Amycolatopsis sp.]
MSVTERVRSRTQQLLGEAKKVIGRTTGNRKLRGSGRADRVVGTVREAGNEVVDWARTAFRDARRRIARRRPVS